MAPMRCGHLEIHVELNEIAGPAGRQRLEPQAMTVLALLAGEPGRVWSRDELLERAWPDRVVSDATLTGVISRLRQTIRGAGVRDVRIETRSKRGYLLAQSGTAAPRSTSKRQTWIAALIGAMLILCVAGVLGLNAGGLSTADGVRLDFEIVSPDGSMSAPAVWLEDGKPGRVQISGKYPLDIRVVPAVSGGGLLRLKFEAGGLSHWASFEQVIALNTESRFTLRSEEPGSLYVVRFVASPDDAPGVP